MGAIYTIDSKGSLQIASAIDVLSGLGSSFVEDFDSGPSISGSVATSTQPWNLNNGSGGSLSGTPTNGSATNPGVWTLATGTTSSSGRSGILRGLSVTTGYLYLGSVYEIYCEWVSQIPTLSAGADTFDTAVGLGDAVSTSGIGTNGLIWRQSTGGVWQCQIVSGGVVSGLSLASAGAASTGWVRQVVKLDKTNVIWQMATGRNAALSTVHTVPIASLPAGLIAAPIGQMARIQKVAGANSREVRVDLCRFALS